MTSRYSLFFHIPCPDCRTDRSKYRSLARSPSLYKLDVTQLLLLWCWESNAYTQHHINILENEVHLGMALIPTLITQCKKHRDVFGMTSAEKRDSLLLFMIILLIYNFLLQCLHGNMRQGDHSAPLMVLL